MIEEAKANYPATFTMHTPTGPTHCCVKHARMVEDLFRFMGTRTNATRAPAGAECANCINEAESQRLRLEETARVRNS